MPRIITQTVYTFEELSEEAKQKALENVRNSSLDAFGWAAESRKSIEAFCEKFGVTLKTWSVGPWAPYEFSHDAQNANFRGVKLESIDVEESLTGYCLDFVLLSKFKEHFKLSGDALGAFGVALEEGFREWRRDWEQANEGEPLAEFLQANGYEFTESGERA